MTNTRDPIRHVIVLMLENRSFDHMLGDLRRIQPDVDGVDRATPRSNLDPKNGAAVKQSAVASYALPRGVDLGHEPENVDRQLALDGPAPMSGFVDDYRQSGGKDDALPEQIMGCFPVGDSAAGDSLPALQGLAREFVVCDRWFSSLPGPTWPNRLFALTGTSGGHRHMPSLGHPTVAPWVYGQDTIFDRFAEKGLKARVYSAGMSMTAILTRMWRHPDWRSKYDDFETAAAQAEENFPAFAWIEPDYFGSDASDQHPPHDVRLGDRFVAAVYNTLRKNEALWNSTLLIVTYDEHGGFFDHVKPPAATPPDDGHDGQFRFDRLGVRVPAVLISPWLARSVCHSTFDHTSVLRYLCDKWQLRPLGRRAASANSIAEALSFLPQQRSDAPLQLAEARTRSLAAPQAELNATQAALLHSIALQEAALSSPSPRMARRALARGSQSPRQRVESGEAAYAALDQHFREAGEQRTLRVLCVHGVGHGDADTAWRDRWRAVIAADVARQGNAAQWVVETEFATYDDLFEAYPLGPKEIAKAILRMTGGLIEGTPGGAHRGLFDSLMSIDETLRWTAGMAVQWIDHAALRDALCKRVGEHMDRFQPHLVAAHSLGSLISYDLMRRDVAAGNAQRHSGRVLLTFGSQIAHPAVLPVFDGRVEPLHDAAGNGVAHWYHLYNARDRVFTRPLPLADAQTTNLVADFDCPGDILNHDGGCYLGREEGQVVWSYLTARSRSMAKIAAQQEASVPQPFTAPAILRTRPSTHRALLVGINAYPDPANRLEGCVNDTFLMSGVLQEYGFDAQDIRLLLDERATRNAMVDRMDWLVDGMRPNDVRVLFYSGHGTQIPSYGPLAEPDGMDESLVPYDFDWTGETAFTDKEFLKFYSQLPYASHFLGVFDCCHAGGMTRGASRVRGLDPPDDVRHRSLRWSKDDQMWVPRDWVPKRDRPNRLFSSDARKATDPRSRQLGQATLMRSKTLGVNRQQDRTRELYGHKGPYMPLLMYACGESELASEYEHGSVSYGAFSFVLARSLREMKQGASPQTLQSAVKATATQLSRLGYDQSPEMIGSSAKYPSRTNLAELLTAQDEAPAPVRSSKPPAKRKSSRKRA